MKKPEISVIMPVYNAERFLKDAVRSILNQTFTDFEFIIIDDGSDDRSLDIIKSFDDPRIKLYTNEKAGVPGQLNFGIGKSSADLIARMDADDLSDLRRLEIQYDFLKNNPEVSLVGSNYSIIDKKGNFVVEKQFPENHNEIEFMMPVITSVLHATMLARKSAIIVAGGYDEKNFYAEDHDLFLRMLLNGCMMYNIQKSLFKYRIHEPRKNNEKFTVQNKVVYENGYNYLRKKYNEQEYKSFDYVFRYALLEYYRGSMNTARKYLFRAIKAEPAKINQVLRYLVVSMLGDGIIGYLRRNNLLNRLNILLNKYLKKDMQSINSNLMRK